VFAVCVAQCAICGVTGGGCGGLLGAAAQGGGRGGGVDSWVVQADCEGVGAPVQRGGQGAVWRCGGVESPELSGYSPVQLGAAVCDGGEDGGSRLAVAGLADGAGRDCVCGARWRTEDLSRGECSDGRGLSERLAGAVLPRRDDDGWWWCAAVSSGAISLGAEWWGCAADCGAAVHA